MLRQLWKDEAGSPAVEFVLVASVISLAALGAFMALGQQSKAQLGNVQSAYVAVN